MRNIKFTLNGPEVDPGSVREFTGLYDGTKREDLTEREQADWLLKRTKEE